MDWAKLSELLWIFFLYAFLGWCVEVIFHVVSQGKFINRGFLSGPVCPIYGFGVLAVVLCLEPVKGNLLVLFIGSILLTSVLEFITGFVLEKFFKDKWWDYSDRPFNICGYVCLEFSLAWGLACVLVVKAVHPAVLRFIHLIPHTAGIVLLCVFGAMFAVDIATTLSSAMKLRHKLIFAERTEKGIRRFSEGIGDILTDGTLATMVKLEEGKEFAERQRERLTSGQLRLLRAFPRLKEGRYKAGLEAMKQRIEADLDRIKKR